MSRPAVSQHLRVLKAAGLVRDRAAGTRRLYQIDPAGVADMRAYLDRLWDHALTDFKAVAEAAQQELAQKSTHEETAEPTREE